MKMSTIFEMLFFFNLLSLKCCCAKLSVPGCKAGRFFFWSCCSKIHWTFLEDGTKGTIDSAHLSVCLLFPAYKQNWLRWEQLALSINATTVPTGKTFRTLWSRVFHFSAAICRVLRRRRRPQRLEALEGGRVKRRRTFYDGSGGHIRPASRRYTYLKLPATDIHMCDQTKVWECN